jgi:hypothetical protein
VTTSVVLRLSSTALVESRLTGVTGEALPAGAGRRAVVASADDLLAFVLAGQPALRGPLTAREGATSP